MNNEELLNNLRENTSKLLMWAEGDLYQTEEDLEKLAASVSNDFIKLDISLSYNNGDLPGAWGSSKLSKSNLS